MAEEVRERERAKRTEGVDEQRVRAVERMDEAAARNRRPAPRLHRAADLQRQLVEPDFPVGRVDATFTRQSPQRTVGADVVEAVIVNARVREVRRHPRERALAAEIEKRRVARRIELQQRRAVLKSFRPLGPSARRVAPVDGEDGRAVPLAPRRFQRSDFSGGELEDAVDRVAGDPRACASDRLESSRRGHHI